MYVYRRKPHFLHAQNLASSLYVQDEDGKGDDEGEHEEGEEGGEYMSRNSRLVLMLEDELPNCHNQERVDEFAVRGEGRAD